MKTVYSDLVKLMAFSKTRVKLDYDYLQDKLAELFAAKEPLR